MTCKDCPHFDVCKMYGALPTKRRINSKWKNCPFRNDKAKYIELPDTVYVQGVIGKINAKDPATGAKLSAAVISVLQSTAQNLEVKQ